MEEFLGSNATALETYGCPDSDLDLEKLILRQCSRRKAMTGVFVLFVDGVQNVDLYCPSIELLIHIGWTIMHVK